jgi:HAE1 family hydrophobic/amphiphilic exporter-1/multidrug efflux pump
VNKANAKLPPEALAAGISIKKKSPDMLLAIAVYSPDKSYDDVFLSNYTSINLVDPIARTTGVGSTMLVGQRDYSMRFWVRPDRLSRLGLTGPDIANIVKEQNVVAPAGQVGQLPARPGTQFQYSVNVKGRLVDVSEFENMIVRTLPDGSILRMKDVARTELSAKTYTSFGRRDGIPSVILIVYQLPAANALETAERVKTLLADLKKNFPPGLDYNVSLDTTIFVEVAIHEVILALPRRDHTGVDRRIHLPGESPRDVHPDAGRAGFAGGHFRRLRGPGLLDQSANDAGSGTGCGYRRGRCHRRRRGCGA